MSKSPDIALIPSGYKESPSTLYTILPNDGSQDFGVIRTGNATRVRKDGLIEEVSSNVPRLDWLNTNCPSVLTEAERVNRLRNSEDLSNTSYSKVGITVTTDQIISPSGELNADKITRTSTSANYVSSGATKSSATQMDVNFSLFVKQGEGDYFAMRMQGAYPQRGEAIYQFSTNTITTSIPGTNPTNTFSFIKKKVENYGNGWYRLSVTFNTDANTTVSGLFSPRSTSGTIDANDTSSTAFAYVWGCQIEEGTGATSYIPTTSQIATRNLDNLECTTAYTLGENVTLFFDFEAYSFDGNFKSTFLIRDSGFQDFFDLISYESGGQYYFRSRFSVGGQTIYLINFGEILLPFYSRNKFAVRITNGQLYEVYVNGVSVKTGDLGGVANILKGINIQNDFGNSTERASTKLYDFRVYNQALTTTEALNLTI